MAIASLPHFFFFFFLTGVPVIVVISTVLKKEAESRRELSVRVFGLSAVHGVFFNTNVWLAVLGRRALHSLSHHPLSGHAKRMLTCIWSLCQSAVKRPRFWFIMHKMMNYQSQSHYFTLTRLSLTFNTLPVARLLWILRPLDTHLTENEYSED